MTLAAAIAAARIGQDDGFAALYQHAVASVYFAAVLSGCSDIPRMLVRIYREAREELLLLRSPSALRLWQGRVVYRILTDGEQPLPRLGDRMLERAAQAIRHLESIERRALLLTCADGCSAAQAAEILAIAEIEVKRAVRRARKQVAQEMEGFGVSVNTAWLLDLMQRLKEELRPEAAMVEQVRACVMEGKELPPREPQLGETGFLARWFRAKRT